MTIRLKPLKTGLFILAAKPNGNFISWSIAFFIISNAFGFVRLCMHFSYTFIIELLGTAVFAISGTFSAVEKKLDVFGVMVLAFVTAIGGGTIRDVLIGDLPVTWLRDLTTPLTILAATCAALAFRGVFKICRRPCCYLIRLD